MTVIAVRSDKHLQEMKEVAITHCQKREELQRQIVANNRVIHGTNKTRSEESDTQKVSKSESPLKLACRTSSSKLQMKDL